MIASFTGPTTLRDPQGAFVAVADVIENLPHDATIRSGGADGIDTMVLRVAKAARPDLRRVLLTPAAPFNEECVKLADEVLAVHALVPEPAPQAYRRRNRGLVSGADILYAFLRAATFYRSGEWMTLNIAKSLNVPYELRLVA